MLGKIVFAMFATAVAAEEWDEVFKGNGKDMTFDDLFEELSQKEPAFRWLSGNASNASNASNATNGTNATNATNTTQAATTAAATTAAATTAAATTAATTAAPTTKAATQAPNRDAYKAAISASFNIPVPAGQNATSFAKTLQSNAAFKGAVESQFKAGLCGTSTTCAVALKSVSVKTLRLLEEEEAIQRRLATAEFVFSFDVTGLSAEQAHSVSSAGATELAAVTATFKAALKAAPAVLQALGLTAADVDAMTAGTMTVAVSDSNGKAVSTADLAAATTTKKATTAAATTAGSATTTAAATTSGAFEQSVVLSVALALFSRALF